MDEPVSATMLLPVSVRCAIQPASVTLLLHIFVPVDGSVSKFCAYRPAPVIAVAEATEPPFASSTASAKKVLL